MQHGGSHRQHAVKIELKGDIETERMERKKEGDELNAKYDEFVNRIAKVEF